MPEVQIEIGGRPYQVACAAGEEEHLLSAAGMLNTEATALINAAGRLPEQKVLLMAGLMLADKMAAKTEAKPQDSEATEQLAQAQVQIAALEAELKEAQAALAEASAVSEAEPQTVVDTSALERMAVAAEALADRAEGTRAAG